MMGIEWIDHAHYGNLNLTNCDGEPIQIPGLIQPQGFMLIVDPGSQNIVSFSANVPILFDMPDWHDRELHLSDFFSARELGEIGHFCSSVATAPNLECFMKPVAGNQYEITAIDTVDYWFVEGILAPEQPSDLIAVNNIVAAAISDFSLASTIQEACEKTAKIIRKIVSYDRVMLYRFDADWNGEVTVEEAAEELDNRFLHLHFPHTDIPVQARVLYLKNKTRVLMDADSETLPLVPETDPLNDAPFDMKLAHLRAVSPIHIEYMRNMGVRASLVISVIVDDQLWGLIACHDYHADRRVSIPTRRACQCISDLLASTISRLSAREFNQGIEIANRMAERIRSAETSPGGTHEILKHYREDIRRLFDAQGIGWKIGEDRFSDGLTASLEEIESIRRYSKDGVLIYDAFPEIVDAVEVSSEVGGIVLLAVSNDCSDYLYLTRQIESRTIPWSGEPDAKLKVAADQGVEVELTPRKSFERWEESIKGRSESFQIMHFQIANILRNVIIESNLEEQNLRPTAELAADNALPGVPSRNLLLGKLEQMIERHPNESFAIVLVGIDEFDQIVSSLGQSATESLLGQFSDKLDQHCGEFELVQIGSDQIATVLCPAPPQSALHEFAIQLRNSGDGGYSVGEESTHISCCAAYAGYPDHGLSAARILESAEIALRQAKRTGPGQIIGYSNDLLEQVQREKRLDSRLRNAFANGQLEHHFQPIVDTRSGAIVGGEALMRWNDPKGGIVYPKDFMPALMRMELLGEIDEGLIESFVENISTLTKVRPDFFISYNLTGQMFEQRNTPALDDLLTRMEPVAKHIAFEITERHVTEFPEECLLSIRKMRNDGFQVLLDDFGTGHSSLAFLNDYPVTGIKIDNRFVRNIEHPKTEKLVESMQNIAFDLDLTTICEGVEQRAQAARLSAKGCYLHQGRYYYEPMPWEQFRKEIRRNRSK